MRQWRPGSSQLSCHNGRADRHQPFDQLNDVAPSDQIEPEDIEALLSALSDADIQLVEE
jgi:hypothetical protein